MSPRSICTTTAGTADLSARGHGAFSLAELMIALVILGLGLLFIAAALPVGLEYTRRTVNLANADAAADYALDQLEANLRTSVRLYDWGIADPTGANTIHRLDNIHRPRDFQPGAPPRYPLNNTYEPLVKVRPLAMSNIRIGSIPGGGSREITDDVEAAITRYLTEPAIVFPMPPEYTLERDFTVAEWPALMSAYNPALPALARVYPPTEPVTTLSVDSFFNNYAAYPTYQRRLWPTGTLSQTQTQNEWEKGLDTRIAWTAFYRRVSYKFHDPDGLPGNGDEVAEEPLRYELIVVVTQRTSVNHRFPRQNLAVTGLNALEQPVAWTPASPPTDDSTVGIDRLAPMPWLVTFVSGDPLWVTPQLTAGAGGDYVVLGTGPNYFERVLLNTFNDPPTLTFRCSTQLGALLPVGSVLIPAVNDQRFLPPAQAVGFVPSTNDSLPIYEVVERPDDTTVVVKNNGYYPWVDTGLGLDAGNWPVWVIPPAFVERDSNGQPVYDRTSPILKIVRRTITLPEINR